MSGNILKTYNLINYLYSYYATYLVVKQIIEIWECVISYVGTCKNTKYICKFCIHIKPVN